MLVDLVIRIVEWKGELRAREELSWRVLKVIQRRSRGRLKRRSGGRKVAEDVNAEKKQVHKANRVYHAKGKGKIQDDRRQKKREEG